MRQEISKRLDVTLSRIGIQPGRNGLSRTSGLPGKFFFSTNELPQRVGLLRKHLPGEAESIVAEANEICRHRFRLLGYRDVDYGAEVDWHLDPVHGLRSPLIPWFKFNFLDFAGVGDHKVTWELSRHQQLVTLAKAWLLSGQDGYAQEILAQWYSWQRANPYPLGVNWASSLEVAFRSLSWIWLLHLLAECPVVPPGFRDDLVRALALNGRHIERYLSTYFSPNTHLLGEAVALFFSEHFVRKFRLPRIGRRRAGKLFKKKSYGRCDLTAYISSNRCTTTFMRLISSCTRVCWPREMGWRFRRASISSSERCWLLSTPWRKLPHLTALAMMMAEEFSIPNAIALNI